METVRDKTAPQSRCDLSADIAIFYEFEPRAVVFKTNFKKVGSQFVPRVCLCVETREL